MTEHLDDLIVEFERVILLAELAGIEQDPQQLRIVPGGPLRRNQQDRSHCDPAKETAEEVENGPAEYQRGKEQPSLRSQDGEGFVDSSVNWIDPSALHCI
jgi:hypothetical protein